MIRLLTRLNAPERWQALMFWVQVIFLINRVIDNKDHELHACESSLTISGKNALVLIEQLVELLHHSPKTMQEHDCQKAAQNAFLVINQAGVQRRSTFLKGCLRDYANWIPSGENTSDLEAKTANHGCHSAAWLEVGLFNPARPVMTSWWYHHSGWHLKTMRWDVMHLCSDWITLSLLLIGHF